MNQEKRDTMNRLRSYSSAFSSTSFSKLLKNDDYSFLDAKIERYDLDLIGDQIMTYHDYVFFIYNKLRQNYKNEYVYKNTLINEIIINKYGLKNSVVLNEFKVGKSIADIVMFNGNSKVFEIKTELDSNKRLESQLADYSLLFNERYIVTHKELTDKYLKFDSSIGIIELSESSKGLKMKEVRLAVKKNDIDYKAVMRSTRTSEYKTIIKKYYGKLPDMDSFNMFDICHELMSKIPKEKLNHLFIEQIKHRKSNTGNLKSLSTELRQIGLALQLNFKKSEELFEKLNKPIQF